MILRMVPSASADFSSLNDDQTLRINNLFNNVPEPWQVRLPWLSFVMDPNPYASNGVIYSYRTRTNIKVLYDMRAFFDNSRGAFSGNPVNPLSSDDSYQHRVDLGIYLHLMDDNTKLKRQFFQDLATGRKIIFSGSNYDKYVSNAKVPDTVIAKYYSVN